MKQGWLSEVVAPLLSAALIVAMLLTYVLIGISYLNK